MVDDCDSDSDYVPIETSVEKLLNMWKKGTRLLNEFWKIWRNDYLTSLRERTQLRLKQGRVLSDLSPAVGDIVQVKDNVPRGCWKIGKILSLAKSNDGHIRSGKVALSSGRVMRRPINLLYPLELSSCNDSEDNSSNPSIQVGRASRQHTRPCRKAAEKAKENIKKCL